ncbi:MAG TPA: YjbE family putative metal transport protein [Rhizomicrobium sp.]|nr:YjbE family putative metal transport protein [Rhizomicrobium sp.]
MSQLYEQALTYLGAHGAIFALFQVILIDIVMAGDNAVVIGMAAARLPKALRHKVIFWGLAAAVVMRVFLATITVELFAFIPLRVVGGILLLWVAWRLYRDIRQSGPNGDSADGPLASLKDESGQIVMRRAILQITIADISMSLDNVLAVAGVALHHVWVLAIGLVLSIGLMGIAANLVAKLLNRHAWISYAGVFIVLYVALTMIYHGGMMIITPPLLSELIP